MRGVKQKGRSFEISKRLYNSIHFFFSNWNPVPERDFDRKRFKRIFREYSVHQETIMCYIEILKKKKKKLKLQNGVLVFITGKLGTWQCDNQGNQQTAIMGTINKLLRTGI